MRLPHTLVMKPVAEFNNGNTNRVDGIAWAEEGGASIKCQITPESPVTTFQKWGVELLKPHLMIFRLTDAENIKQGDMGTHNGRVFIVSTGPQQWDSGLGGTQHCEIMLDEQPRYQ